MISFAPWDLCLVIACNPTLKEMMLCKNVLENPK
jgi:hypothetical protein